MKPIGVKIVNAEGGNTEGHGGGMVQCVHVMGILGKVR